jgi:hypothetical protein
MRLPYIKPLFHAFGEAGICLSLQRTSNPMHNIVDSLCFIFSINYNNNDNQRTAGSLTA